MSQNLAPRSHSMNSSPLSWEVVCQPLPASAWFKGQDVAHGGPSVAAPQLPAPGRPSQPTEGATLSHTLTPSFSTEQSVLCSRPREHSELSKYGCFFHSQSVTNIWGKKMNTRHGLETVEAKRWVVTEQALHEESGALVLK